jgi:hypothetical protein
MRAATIRRMIVFSVCALGVGSLYLVPSIARSPEQLGVPKVNDEPTSQPAGAQPDRSPQSASPTGEDDSLTGGDRERSQAADPATQPTEAATQKPDNDEGRSTRKAVAEPKATKDSEPPHPVADIEPSTVAAHRLSLKWPAARDNVGVIGYRIWLNGFEVATTAETHARLRWFNDDSGQHVVQIRALDAAGNQSRSSPTLVLKRPSPDPTDAPTPSESPTPHAEPTDSGRPDSDSDSPRATATDDSSEPRGKNR